MRRGCWGEVFGERSRPVTERILLQIGAKGLALQGPFFQAYSEALQLEMVIADRVGSEMACNVSPGARGNHIGDMRLML